MTYFILIESFKGKCDPFWREIAFKLKSTHTKPAGLVKGILFEKFLEENRKDFNEILDELIIFNLPSPHDINTEVKANILRELMRNNNPSILFMGFTHQGIEFGPAIAWDLKIPLITNCVELEWQQHERVLAKRVMYGGKYVTTISTNVSNGAIFSIQKGAWKTKNNSEIETGELKIANIQWNRDWSSVNSEALGIIEMQDNEDHDITKANLLVSVGRGVADAEEIKNIKELANCLKGTLSCSRPIVDFGLLPAYHQVGISGKSVSPTIYLALGISGQANHLAGINSSSMIIAVNKDAQAPIFQIADYGVVADCLDIVSELKEIIEQRAKG